MRSRRCWAPLFVSASAFARLGTRRQVQPASCATGVHGAGRRPDAPRGTLLYNPSVSSFQLPAPQLPVSSFQLPASSSPASIFQLPASSFQLTCFHFPASSFHIPPSEEAVWEGGGTLLGCEAGSESPQTRLNLCFYSDFVAGHFPATALRREGARPISRSPARLS